jgi:glycosyltransferase involved in cell wall biosynthesis
VAVVSDDIRPTVLFAVHSTEIGGAQLMALAAAEHLSDSYELHIACPPGPLRERFAGHGRLLAPCSNMTFGWGTRSRSLLRVLRSVIDGLRIARYVRRYGIRVVYTNSAVLAGPVLGARLARVPAIVHARELPPDAWARALFAVLGALADTIIAISQPVEEAFAGVRRARVVRIHDGVVIPTEAPTRRGFRSSPRLCIIGTVGGDGRKGHDIAIDALARVAAEGVDAHLYLVGPIIDDGSQRTLEHRADALGVGERLQLTGPTDRVEEAIDSSDIVLSCAREEPLGLTLMEALARATPIVATRVGGVPEIVRDGQTGLLVTPENPDAVARAIVDLLADPDRALAMARRGRVDVAARFDRTVGLEALDRELARLSRRVQVTTDTATGRLDKRVPG